MIILTKSGIVEPFKSLFSISLFSFFFFEDDFQKQQFQQPQILPLKKFFKGKLVTKETTLVKKKSNKKKDFYLRIFRKHKIVFLKT